MSYIRKTIRAPNKTAYLWWQQTYCKHDRYSNPRSVEHH